MLRIVADINAEGYLAYLVRKIRRDPHWHYFASELNIEFLSFGDIELDKDSNDRQVWLAAQRHGAILLTDNRNHDGKDSLQAVINELNKSNSYPVITIGDLQRIVADPEYVERVIEALFERLMFIDGLKGTGRLFIP